jgi:hypothetical protein
MFKLNNFITLSVILALVGCSGSDGESLSTIEATVTSSNDNPAYDEVYTISWQSNASQCYATSVTGSWLGELEPSGSQDFVAKREGIANYGVQCRTSINFVNASTDVTVSKEFKDYFDYIDVDTFDLGSLSLSASSQVSVLDTTIADFNADFRLDLVMLLEVIASSDTRYYFLTFYGQDVSTITEDDPYTFIDLNQDNCVADEFIRADYNDDGLLDIMSISKSGNESLNKRGICFFLASEDGLTLQDESYLTNETNLDLSNVNIGSHVAYDVNANFKPDILLFGNGGSTDLPFYIIPSEEGPFVLIAPPLDTLNPFTRDQGCLEGLTFLCDWIDKEYNFKNSVITPANDDGTLDVINSVSTSDGVSYILYDTRIVDDETYFDWSISTNDYLTTSISSGDGIALKMVAADGNLDGYTDLFVFEKSFSNSLYKLSIYEKIISDEEDATNELASINNGDFPEEFSFDGGLNFTKDFLLFDFDSSGYADIFLPYTELPFSADNLVSDKHFTAFEKSVITNEDETITQEWITQDISDLIGLDPKSVNNSWIDFDGDGDIDVILITPESSNDGLSINYNFKISLNNSLF